jgi:hypothetical protein
MSRKSFRLLLPLGQFVLLISLWHLGSIQKKIFCDSSPLFCNATDTDPARAWDAIVVIDFPLIIMLAPLGFLAPMRNFPDWVVVATLAVVTPFFWIGFASAVDRYFGAYQQVGSSSRGAKWGLWVWFLVFATTAVLASVAFAGNHFPGRWLELGAAVWSALAAAACLVKIVLARDPAQLSSTGSG